MPSLTAAVMGARDPVREYLRSYYGAQELSDNREERKRQIAEQQLRMTLMEQQRAYQRQKDEQASLEGAVGDLGQLAAAQTLATGQQPDEKWLETTWRQVASQKGLDLNKYPNPGPYGAGVLNSAKVSLDKMQREIAKQQADQAKKSEPLVRDFIVGDQTVPHRYNPETTQWEPIQGMGGPRYKEPAPQTPRFTVQQGVDAQGHPIWVRINNLTGEVAPVTTQGASPPPKNAPNNEREVAQARAALQRERAAALAKPMNFPDYTDTNGRFSENLFRKRAPRTVLADYPEDVVAAATGQEKPKQEAGQSGYVQVPEGTPGARHGKPPGLPEGWYVYRGS